MTVPPSPRVPLGSTPRRRDAEATRAEIVRAAQFLFSERGYAHVTLQEIAELAGVTAALVVRYFGSKAKLFALIAHLRSRIEEPIDEGADDPETVARTVLEFWRDAAARAPALALVRSIDFDGGDLLREELERRIIAPYRIQVAQMSSSDARVRLILSLVMGIGLFGLDGLLGEPDALSEEEISEVATLLTRLFGTLLTP